MKTTKSSPRVFARIEISRQQYENDEEFTARVRPAINRRALNSAG
jgi:hypothetical protein